MHLLLSAALGVALALLINRLPPPTQPEHEDPSYSPRTHATCDPPSLRERAFTAGHDCLSVEKVGHTSFSVLISPPSNSSYALLVTSSARAHELSVDSPGVFAVADLTPDTDYTLELRNERPPVCRFRASTRPSSRNLLLNPSFESSAQPPHLATRFHPSQADAPRQWTPFYNGGARRVCGVVRLAEQEFAEPRHGNCVLMLGRLPSHLSFNQGPQYYGAHQAVPVDSSNLVVSAWYRTSLNMKTAAEITSRNDSLSLVVSYVLDGGIHSDGIIVSLEKAVDWTPICVQITAPRGRVLKMLHIYVHLHDYEEGSVLLLDDAAVFEGNANKLSSRCHAVSTTTTTPSPTPHTPCRHLVAHFRPHPKQLTLAVPLTTDRVIRLEAMSRLYAGGPLAAAVIVRNREEARIFASVWKRKKWLRLHVDVTFVKRSNSALPVNTARNIAVRLAQTDFVVMLDVDMTPATHAFECFRDYRGKYLESILPQGEKRVLTLPVFVTDVHHRSAKDKGELLNMLGQRVATTYCVNSQKPNKIKRWYVSNETSEVRFLTDYEPYGIVRRDLHPWYDERFSGYGFNKIAWALSAESAGWRMFVLPDHFVTHLNHVENEWVSSIDVGHYLQTWRRYLAFAAEAATGWNVNAAPVGKPIENCPPP